MKNIILLLTFSLLFSCSKDKDHGERLIEYSLYTQAIVPVEITGNQLKVLHTSQSENMNDPIGAEGAALAQYCKYEITEGTYLLEESTDGFDIKATDAAQGGIFKLLTVQNKVKDGMFDFNGHTSLEFAPTTFNSEANTKMYLRGSSLFHTDQNELVLNVLCLIERTENY